VEELRPDVLTVDLYMEAMNGVELIRRQMERRPLPIVVCSSTAEGSESFIAAMDAGAVEFVGKPTARALDQMFHIEEDLIRAVEAAAEIPFEKLPGLADPYPAATQMPAAGFGKGNIDAVLIGISTGGPRALRAIIPRFPASFPAPIAIALHMPVGYTNALAENLNRISQVEVLESRDGIEMRPGRVILAQAGLHTGFRRTSDRRVVTVLSDQPANVLYRPSVDALFRSGAEVYGERLLGVVMTGMGRDGTEGAGWIKAQGGLVFAEAEETSVIYGMPRSVVEAGLADRVIPLYQIPEAIMEVFQ
jgi:two-component system chemotaxis response regulator CheB